jgi:hypothetical protein
METFVWIGRFDVPIIFLTILGRAYKLRRVGPIRIFGFLFTFEVLNIFFWWPSAVPT